MTDYGATAGNSVAPSYGKDPSDVIDIPMSWQQLGTDAIIESSWTSEGLTVGTAAWAGLNTWCFVSGGTAGSVYNLTNTITTGMGRTLQRTVYIAVSEL